MIEIVDFKLQNTQVSLDGHQHPEVAKLIELYEKKMQDFLPTINEDMFNWLWQKVDKGTGIEILELPIAVNDEKIQISVKLDISDKVKTPCQDFLNLYLNEFMVNLWEGIQLGLESVILTHYTSIIDLSNIENISEYSDTKSGESIDEILEDL